MKSINNITYLRLILYLLLSVFSSVLATAQLPEAYTHFNLTSGLPDANINCIDQDKYGYVWIGTDNGLVRFDGKNFVSFNSSPAFASLPSDEILALQFLNTNTLVVVTRRGLCLIDVSNMTASDFVIPPRPGEEVHEVNKPRGVLIGNDGSMFITTWSGFYHFNNKKELVSRYDDYPVNSKSAKGFGVYTLWLNNSNILLAGQNGFYVYNIPSKKIEPAGKLKQQFLTIAVIERFTKHQNCHLLQIGIGQILALPYKTDSFIYIDENKKLATASKIPVDSVKSLFTWRSALKKINDSTLLLSGKFSSLYSLKLNPNTGALQLDTNAYFKKQKCNVVFIDNNNRYWIGFSDGLKMQKNSPVNLRQHPQANLYEKEGQRSNIHQTAATARYVYTAAPTSGGAYRFNKQTLEFDRLIPFPFPPFGNKSLHSATAWCGDTVLFGSDAGLFLYSEKKGNAAFVQLPDWSPQYNWVGKIFVDNKKNAWISTNKTGGCYLWKYGSANADWFDFGKTLPQGKEQIGEIIQSPDGNIWIAGNGIARYNTAKQKIDYYKERIATNAMQTNNFSSIAFDEAGSVWLSNWTVGLIKLNQKNDSVTVYDQLSGIPDKKINALAYHNGYIWVVCKNGISKMNIATGKISSVVNLKDVYYQPFFCDKLILDTATNFFFTGTGQHIIRFEPGYAGFKKISPTLVLVYAKSGMDSIIWFPQNKLNVKWKNRNVSLFVNAINYEDAEYQRYAYRLTNGKASDWINIDEQRRITLTNLKKGTTIVEIKVYSPQNAWPEKTISFTIKVIAPFWKTIWFQLLCILLILAILFSIYKYRLNHAKKIMRIRDNISKDLHDEVGATLSGIAMYSHLIKGNLANKQLDAASQSAGVIQHSATEMVTKLNDIIWLINPQKESLVDLIAKLKEYALNMCAAKNISTAIEISGPVADCKPPIETRKNIYLFCKEAINNAVKYSNAKRLIVNFQLMNNLLTITIRDNGEGFDLNTVQRGNGLDNIEKRADDIGAVFSIHSAPQQGCTITLKLKITRQGIV